MWGPPPFYRELPNRMTEIRFQRLLSSLEEPPLAFIALWILVAPIPPPGSQKISSSLWLFRLMLTGCRFSMCIVSIERRWNDCDVYTDKRGIRSRKHVEDEPGSCFRTYKTRRLHPLGDLYTINAIQTHPSAPHDCHTTDSIGLIPLPSKVLQILSHMLILGSNGGGHSTDWTVVFVHCPEKKKKILICWFLSQLVSFL